MINPPVSESIIDKTGITNKSWVVWFNTLWEITGAADNSGTTANRPTVGLYVGRFYFDTTLGKPIWLKSVRPTVWVLATGAAA